MNNCIYYESLASGGTFCVSPSEWKITYRLCARDNKYNGTTATISSIEIEDCIKEIITAYTIFQKLMEENVVGCSFRTPGPMGLLVVTSVGSNGVYLTEENSTEFILLFRDKLGFEKLLKDYLACRIRAQRIQEIMNTSFIAIVDVEDDVNAMISKYTISSEKLSDVLSELKKTCQSKKKLSLKDKLLRVFTDD